MKPDYIEPDLCAAFDRKLALAELRWKRMKWLAVVIAPSLAALLVLFLWKITHE